MKLRFILFIAAISMPSVSFAMMMSEVSLFDLFVLIAIPVIVVVTLIWLLVRGLVDLLRLRSNAKKNELVSFIEDSTTKEISISEWNKYMVDPYSDKRMEETRRECVTLLVSHEATPVESQALRQQLIETADRLRDYSK